MKNEVFYCLVLSESQARFLATSKYGIDRMKALVSLIGQASTSYHEYKKKGFEIYVQIGQVVISEVELSRLWGCDRKTVSRVLDTMNELELVATEQNNRTSIHTLLCVSAWYIDGQKILNPFYVPMKDRFPDETCPANKDTINGGVGSAGSPSNPAQSEQNLALVPEENVRSGLVPESQQSISHDHPTIYNNVKGAEDVGRYTSSDAASGVYQQKGKENSVDSSPSSPDVVKSFDKVTGQSIRDVDDESKSDADKTVSAGVGFAPDNGKPESGLIPDSASNGAYHSMRDLQIDRMNLLDKK
ncbi:MAG: hypothetical protein J5661_07275 [Bacteroidaceae bacterium]|nr:hypothetical protein [Bacteroidaceae bacterium]